MDENMKPRYCQECGSLLNEDGSCPSCSRMIQPGNIPQSGIPQPPYNYQYQTPQKKSKTVLMLVILCTIIVLLLAALVFVSMHLFTSIRETNISEKDSHDKKSYTKEFSQEEDASQKEEDKENHPGSENSSEVTETESSLGYKYTETRTDVTKENYAEGGQDESLPYYSGPYNSLRKDLSYEVDFCRMDYYSSDLDMMMSIEFPQITSDTLQNVDGINSCLSYEYDYFLDFYKENIEQYMDENSSYYFDVDSYVTYMDEKILSVVYYESIYLRTDQEDYQDIHFYCVNIDLTDYTLLTNTDILELNEDFAIDFRKREAEENGEEALTAYSDQEILHMLQDDSSLVLFYTPMGMEVGLNLDQQIVYVTYSDYEKFLNRF